MTSLIEIHGRVLIRVMSGLLTVLVPWNETFAQAVFPINEGKMVFHRYSSFDNYDGQLYVFDFTLRTLVNVSSSWNVDNATNAHFSPDGTKLVFMGVPKGQHTRASWDIYLWNVASDTAPTDLTEGNGVLDQDPKFFPDGLHVAFKHDGDIAIIDIVSKEITTLTTGGNISEKSMEYPTRDGKAILYAEGSGAQSSIYAIDIASKLVTPLVTGPYQNYYPIVKDDTSFLYARWASASNLADQIYLATFAGASYPAAFNVETSDDSDPYPVDSTIVLFSSDRPGGKGGYDLYVGNLATGATRSLSLFNMNTSLQELGSCYTKNSVPLSVRESSGSPPGGATLRQNYPNPFNPETTIEYRLERGGKVTLAVFDLLGREVAVLVNELQTAGEHRARLDARGLRLSSGIYFCRLTAGDRVQTKAMVVVQ